MAICRSETITFGIVSTWNGFFGIELVGLVSSDTKNELRKSSKYSCPTKLRARTRFLHIYIIPSIIWFIEQSMFRTFAPFETSMRTYNKYNAQTFKLNSKPLHSRCNLTVKKVDQYFNCIIFFLAADGAIQRRKNKQKFKCAQRILFGVIFNQSKNKQPSDSMVLFLFFFCFCCMSFVKFQSEFPFYFLFGILCVT